ncbi:biliverdin-producing heme oxygenase [Parapedobacter koreensis]|nr:biliverdin-producing heme oxygenase [Parapedobacter koreensis]
MISNELKSATRVAHQQLEKTVVRRLKGIRSEADYAAFLNYFYAYFRAVERAIAEYITPEVLPDYTERRNSDYLKRDIESLGGTTETLPTAIAPSVDSTAAALGALYVLEGSIMGGPYIVQLLQKQGITAGFSFFSGYGAETGRMWSAFTEALDVQASGTGDRESVLRAAQETFERFGDVFTRDSIATDIV